jgi:hypothetical protein
MYTMYVCRLAYFWYFSICVSLQLQGFLQLTGHYKSEGYSMVHLCRWQTTSTVIFETAFQFRPFDLKDLKYM